MKATKGNKTYSIDEKDKQRYVDAGYDIQDETGKVIAYGRGKTVSYEEYEKLKAENEALKAENEKLKAETVETESEDSTGSKKKKAGE